MDWGDEVVGLAEQMGCVWVCQLRNGCNGGGTVCSSVVNGGAAAFFNQFFSPFRFQVSAFMFHVPSV